MYTPHLTKKEAKELSLKKGRFLLTLPTIKEMNEFFKSKGFESFKNCCPLCELYNITEDGLFSSCIDECPIKKNDKECSKSNSLWVTYMSNVIYNKGDIYPKGKEALEKLIKIVEEWEV